MFSILEVSLVSYSWVRRTKPLAQTGTWFKRSEKHCFFIP